MRGEELPVAEITTFILSHFSLISCIALGYYTAKRTKRSQLRVAFFALFFIILIWNIGSLLEAYYRIAYGFSNMIFVDICYFGICFAPVAILFLGMAMSRPHFEPKPVYTAVLIVPVISFIVVCTNEYHSLFFKVFSTRSTEAVYGLYYYWHSIYSYGCILIGIILILSFAFKNTGAISTQSVIICVGILVPLVANMLYSFAVVDLNFSVNASMFTFTVICFAVALLKYDFLLDVPIALHQIVDLISDGYFVLDSQNRIVDYNTAVLRIIPGLIRTPKRTYLKDFLDAEGVSGLYDDFLTLQEQACLERYTVSYEWSFPDRSRCFTIELTPVFQKKRVVGNIVLLKDVTQAKRDLETIKETQAAMLERERLASLGQLVGGIAHNLKTPIFSIAGGVEALRDLVDEYDTSVGDASVTADDHREIAEEMRDWLGKIKGHCGYISDMISAVKDQAVQLTPAQGNSFSIDEFLKRVDLLMNHELKTYNCTLRSQVDVDVDTEIAGDVNSLVQIFDNLIINAMHAYEGKAGDIDLCIREVGSRLIFTLTDYGKGIDSSVKARLFREMVTTKGKEGTGLGLYLSYSTIIGHFNGQMTFDSVPGRGSTFVITIPKTEAFCA